MESMGIRHDFWPRKKVFVTGHSGFKGSWLSLWLQRLGADVIGYSLPRPHSNSLFDVASVGRNMVSIWGDINDEANLSEQLGEYKPDIVFHLAAQPLVRESYSNPVLTYMTNVMGTVQLFEAVRHVNSVRVIVNVTSDKCYQNNEWVWSYRENEPMGGNDPYSSSKACSELITTAYRNSFFHFPSSPALASVRAGNVIGGGDWAADRIIPDIVRSLVDNRPLIVRNPRSVRPWQHVLDPLRGYLTLAQRLWQDRSFAGGWNFGPSLDEWVTVKDIIDLFGDAIGTAIDYQVSAEETLHEAHLLRLDSTKSACALQWRPLLDVRESLKWTADWYRAYVVKEDLEKVTLQQIKLYEDRTREQK